MNKAFIYIIMALLCLAAVMATDGGKVGQNITLYSDIMDGAQYYAATSAKINIYAPNGTLLINNASMTQVANGLFSYKFIPTTPGNYYTNTYYMNGASVEAIGSDTLSVENNQPIKGESNMGLGLIIALGIALAIMSYMAFAFKSESNGTTAVWRVFSLIMVVLLLVLLAWASIQSQKDCVFIPSGDSYNYVCEDSPMTAGSMFLRLVLLLTTIFFVWLCVALAISSLEYFRSTGKM